MGNNNARVTYYVSRQCYYYAQRNVVEVAVGGLDYAGSDMLSLRYKHLGEGKEYTDPIEAVEAAITICRAWRKDFQQHRKEVATKAATGAPTNTTANFVSWPAITLGHTMGMGIELESHSFANARAWAEHRAKTLPRCARCGEILGKTTYQVFTGDPDAEYCSENCAENDAENNEG
jgi:hypothetical protein